MKLIQQSIIVFYFLLTANLFCEVGCNPNCDSNESILSIPVEDCSHSTCELSHQNQHNYLKGNSSDLSKKKCTCFNFKILDNANGYIFTFWEVYSNAISKQVLSTHSEAYFFPNRKRFMLFHRLKISPPLRYI